MLSWTNTKTKVSHLEIDSSEALPREVSWTKPSRIHFSAKGQDSLFKYQCKWIYIGPKKFSLKKYLYNSNDTR